MSALVIKEGKTYRTRDGHKAGPLRFVTQDGFGRWKDTSNNNNGRYWHKDGRWSGFDSHPMDLIAEWTEEPAKPASVDTSKLWTGDKVLVRGQLVAGQDGIFVAFNQLTGIPLAKVEIVSVEPRPLAVGDKVRSTRIGEVFIIIAIDGPVGWLKHVDGERYTGPLSELERVP